MFLAHQLLPLTRSSTHPERCRLPAAVFQLLLRCFVLLVCRNILISCYCFASSACCSRICIDMLAISVRRNVGDRGLHAALSTDSCARLRRWLSCSPMAAASASGDGHAALLPGHMSSGTALLASAPTKAGQIQPRRSADDSAPDTLLKFSSAPPLYSFLRRRWSAKRTQGVASRDCRLL